MLRCFLLTPRAPASAAPLPLPQSSGIENWADSLYILNYSNKNINLIAWTLTTLCQAKSYIWN